MVTAEWCNSGQNGDSWNANLKSANSDGFLKHHYIHISQSISQMELHWGQLHNIHCDVIQTRTHSPSHKHIHMNIHIHTYSIHTYTCMYTHTHIHIHIYTCIYTHSHAYTHIHTYIYTHIYIPTHTTTVGLHTKLDPGKHLQLQIII